MNKFVLFVCASVLLSCANARPDLSLGYRYNQGHTSGGGSFLHAPGSIPSSYTPTASGNSYFANQPSVGQVGNSGFVPSTQIGFGGDQGSFGNGVSNSGSSFGNSGSNSGSSFGNGVPNSGSSFGVGNTQVNSGSFQQTSSQYVEQQHGFQAPIVNKYFYVHTAPSDDDQQEIVRHIQIGQPQKNYRVVFIDTPSSNSARAKIIAEVAPTEEKTAIYVLAKKQNALDVSTEVVTPAPVNNKPEVFFIKYRTPEEAVHAQHTIQAQYDALGGSSDVSNEGQIPVSSVIGSLDGHGGHGDHGDHGGVGSVGSVGPVGPVVGIDQSQNVGGPVQITHTGTNTQQTYLPANRRYRIK